MENIVIVESTSEISVLVQPEAETSVSIVQGGTQGIPGANGAKIYTDTGAPSNTLGVDGDFYVRTDTNNYYYKVSGAWVLSGTFGSSLPTGGTTGQGLVKASNSDFDVQWANVVPVGTNNTLPWFNGSGLLESAPGYVFDSTTLGLSASLTVQPNGAGGGQLQSLALAIDPLQNSPAATWNVQNYSVNIDPNSSGFTIGTGGQAAQIFNIGFNHQGTSNIGALNYIAMNSSIGNGTDPITVNGFAFAMGFFNVAANVTLTGSLQGYVFQPNINASAAISSAYTTAFGDFANISCSVYGYSSASFTPIVAAVQNGTNFTSLNLAPNITTFQGNSGYVGVVVSPIIGTMGAGNGFSGMNINPTVSSCVNANGLMINMAGVTASGTKRAIDIQNGDVSINGALQFTGALSIGQLTAFYGSNPVNGGGNPQNMHGLITSMTGLNGVTTANCDVIGVNTAMLITLQPNSINTSGPFGLGFAALALPCVIETHTGSSLDFMSAAVYALNFSGTSTGGTIDTANIARCVPIPNGITTVNKLRGWYYHEPFGPIGTVRHGVYIEDAPGYFEEGILIGGTPVSDDQLTNASVALEIKSTTKAFVSSRMTTTERDAMTAIAGMLIFNTSTNKHQGYDGATWNDFY